jgi:polyphosphate kinase
LRDEVLQAYLRDNVSARELQPDGAYERVAVRADEERFDSQMYFEGMDMTA